jgi:hypothetical protein
MLVTVELDDIGVAWLVHTVRAVDERQLQDCTNGTAKALIGKAVSSVIRQSSRR